MKSKELFSYIKQLTILITGIILFSACGSSKNSGNDTAVAPLTVLKLNPSENNPRNSEGDFLNLKDGRIIFVYTHYYGSSSDDHAPAYLAGRYSYDGGKTWSDTDEVIVENESGMNVMSVSLLRLQNGDIALFYLRKNSREDCIPMMRISKDEAETWSEPVACITEKQGYFVLNNARVIQLKNGRLLAPVSLHQIPGSEWKNQGELYCCYSDDNGTTWKLSGKVPNNTDIVTQEPGVIEMKNGQIMMYIRASEGFQQLSFSHDKGETWSNIEKSNIPSPLSPATIAKIPETDDWLMVWNNNDGANPEIRNMRTPQTMAVSHDEGVTWEKIKNIEDDTDGWYCYTSIYFTDNENLLLGYCAGSQSQKTHLSVTNVTLISRKWIYE